MRKDTGNWIKLAEYSLEANYRSTKMAQITPELSGTGGCCLVSNYSTTNPIITSLSFPARSRATTRNSCFPRATVQV